MKTCTKCGLEKSLDLFSMKNGKPQSRCKECFNEYYRAYWKDTEAYKKHVERMRESRRKNPLQYRAAKYGITKRQLEELLSLHDGKCHGCLENDATDIDHDHSCCDFRGGSRKTCGECVRGILCGQCNKALGLLDDSIERLDSLKNYLKSLEDKSL